MLEEIMVVCPSRSLWSTGSRRGAHPPCFHRWPHFFWPPPYHRVCLQRHLWPSSSLLSRPRRWPLRPLQPYPRQPPPQINAGYFPSKNDDRGAPAVIWRDFCEGAINQGVGTEENRAWREGWRDRGASLQNTSPVLQLKGEERVNRLCRSMMVLGKVKHTTPVQEVP